MGRRTIVVTAALLALIAACSAPAEREDPASQAPHRDSQLPPRPQDVALTGVDPCSLLTPAQRQELGVDRPPRVSPDSDPFGNTYCTHLTASPRGWAIGAVTQEDATSYLSGKRYVDAKIVSAGGFPAVEYRNPGDPYGCFVAVSTTDGQYLNVQYTKSDRDAETADFACEQALRAAGMAVQTLLTQQ